MKKLYSHPVMEIERRSVYLHRLRERNYILIINRHKVMIFRTEMQVILFEICIFVEKLSLCIQSSNGTRESQIIRVGIL